jgi:hypothetical protein
MTPQELETREERTGDRLSTADLAQAGTRPAGPPAPVPNKNGAPESNEPLFASNDTQDFRSRWEKIQIGFVDEPRKAVEQADELVATTIKRLAEVFANERQKLEAEWDKTDNVSTEDLRVALRRYRSFFDRLLSV